MKTTQTITKDSSNYDKFQYLEELAKLALKRLDNGLDPNDMFHDQIYKVTVYPTVLDDIFEIRFEENHGDWYIDYFTFENAEAVLKDVEIDDPERTFKEMWKLYFCDAEPTEIIEEKIAEWHHDYPDDSADYLFEMAMDR